LNIDYIPPEPAPSFTISSLTTGKTNVSFNIQLSNRGKAFCGIFKPNDVITISLIKQQNHQVTIRSNNELSSSSSSSSLSSSSLSSSSSSSSYHHIKIVVILRKINNNTSKQ
jgi:hypothetical protein